MTPGADGSSQACTRLLTRRKIRQLDGGLQAGIVGAAA
jgi:hypothetical protein